MPRPRITAPALCLAGVALLLASAGTFASPSGVDLALCRKAADRVSEHCVQDQGGTEACQAEAERAFAACREHQLAPFVRDRDREVRAAAHATARAAARAADHDAPAASAQGE